MDDLHVNPARPEEKVCRHMHAPAQGGAARRTRNARGTRNHHSGWSAEEQVARAYERNGHRICSRRWRGPAGEIDIVAEKDGEIVFVEVKSSSTHAGAAEALSRRQVERLLASAEDYIGRLSTGLLTRMRIDVALVDGSGRLDVIPNALGA